MKLELLEKIPHLLFTLMDEVFEHTTLERPADPTDYEAYYEEVKDFLYD